MITFSDNIASDTLIANIPESLMNKILGDFGVPITSNGDYMISVKEYASFFRILYNASYLSRGYSDDALNLLSNVSFSGGITTKIPRHILVSHKFGERNIMNDDGTELNQLHDCGIVYYKPYPYLLCVMTRGDTADFPRLSRIIQDVSGVVYQEISEAYK